MFPWRDLWATLAMTSYAVVALGLVAQQTWTAFAFAGDRARWLLLVELAFITWFWADDRLVGSRWWLAVLTRVVAVAVLLGSVVVLGAPGFLTLLVPLMAVVLLVLLVYGQTVTRRARLPWAAAVVQADSARVPGDYHVPAGQLGGSAYWGSGGSLLASRLCCLPLQARRCAPRVAAASAARPRRRSPSVG